VSGAPTSPLAAANVEGTCANVIVELVCSASKHWPSAARPRHAPRSGLEIDSEPDRTSRPNEEADPAVRSAIEGERGDCDLAQALTITVATRAAKDRCARTDPSSSHHNAVFVFMSGSGFARVPVAKATSFKKLINAIAVDDGLITSNSHDMLQFMRNQRDKA